MCSSDLARVEHVLRTDLSIVTGWAGVLAQDFDSMPAEDRREAIDAIHRTSGALGGHVEALLAEASETWGAESMECVPVDVGRVAEAVAVDFTGVQRSVGVRVDLHPSPPALSSAGPLETVLRHLVENAVRHAASLVEIAVEPSDDRRVVVAVRDDGPGLPSGMDVFEAFASTGGTAGRGLGLHVVRTLVDAMGGEVFARDRHDARGAEFVVRLREGEIGRAHV